MVWDFIQNQLLGMKWLNVLIQKIVTACGLDVESRVGGIGARIIGALLGTVTPFCSCSKEGTVNTFKSISMDEGLKLMTTGKDFILLDVRTPEEDLNRAARSWWILGIQI